MLLSIQFPLADSRRFLEEETGLLSLPSWSTPDYNSDFVRSFGSIRVRKRGGVDGWVGEDKICEAHQALKFCKITTFIDSKPDIKLPLIAVYRRFFFDGLALGKFDVGIATRHGCGFKLTKKQTENFVNHFLSLPVEVTDYSGNRVACNLGEAGKNIARLYTCVSTKNCKTLIPSPDWWVKPGNPLLFLQYNNQENIQVPSYSQHLSIPDKWGFKLFYHTIKNNGKYFPLWILGLNSSYCPSKVRALRLYLLRLYAEQECLRLILKNLEKENIILTPRSKASDTLQDYINKATKKIKRWESKSNKLYGTELAEMARLLQDRISPGQRERLLQLLKRAYFRKNIIDKVEHHTNQWYKPITICNNGTVNMTNFRDQYNNAGQVGAQGPESKGQINNYSQVWGKVGGSINLPELAKELSVLRSQLKKEATEPEHDQAIGAIASAESAAKEGKGPKTLEQLAQAGKWALDVATKVGTPIATKALEIALLG